VEKMGKGGGEEKLLFFTILFTIFLNPKPLPHLCINPLLVKHPITIQDGGIEPIYLAFHSEIMPALQAKFETAGVIQFSAQNLKNDLNT